MLSESPFFVLLQDLLCSCDKGLFKHFFPRWSAFNIFSPLLLWFLLFLFEALLKRLLIFGFCCVQVGGNQGWEW